ncbi:MAG: ferritin family protein [Anaerolineaceae bacterium]|jgi:rubrerythrin|nr:ferritin family protein [Anaerolineae bacterium]MDX9832601.1 ferritin family protein [Anaerolineae bacterium]NLF14928.1 ferritin family protein [Anaerolineaceae bacterium]
MDILKIYEYALQREREGRDFFRNNAARFQHAAATGAFEKLAAEEEQHIIFIERLIAALQDRGAEGLKVGEDMEKDGFFSDRAEAELMDQTVIEAMVPDLPVLRTAYLIERDFAEFYEMWSQRVEDEMAKKSLQMLARWERQHEKLFKSMHDRAFEEYASMPWGG